MQTEHKLRVAEDATPVAAPTKPRGRPPENLQRQAETDQPESCHARIAFAKQLDILRAFAAASGPQNRLVNLRGVSDIVKMATGTVTLANPSSSM